MRQLSQRKLLAFGDEKPREQFVCDVDPLTGGPIEPPEQLELKPTPKTQGVFTRNAKRIIRQHKRGQDE